MPFKQDVLDRIAEQRLVELTNPGIPATTVNDTVLDAAIEDTTEQFCVDVGVAFDENDKEHVGVCIQGVLIHLWEYAGNADVTTIRDQWEKRLNRYRIKIGANKRVLPVTNSKLTPGEDAKPGQIVRPRFDINEKFDDYVADRRNRNRSRDHE